MKQEMDFTEQLWKQTQSDNEIWTVYICNIKKEKFIKNFYKK